MPSHKHTIILGREIARILNIDTGDYGAGINILI
jgi:hypothetical protein